MSQSNNALHAFLNRIGENFTHDWFEIRDIQQWMMEEIYRKRKTFPFWRKKVLFSYISWKKNSNLIATDLKPNSELQIDSSPYFEEKLDWLLRYFIMKLMPGFNEKQLDLIKLIKTPQENNPDLFFEYKYHLTAGEIQEYQDFKKEFHHPDHYFRIITYTFNLLIMVFGKLIKEIIKQDLQIAMICAEIKTEKFNPLQKISKDNISENLDVHFLISVSKPDVYFLRTYLYSLIYDFAEILPNINKSLLNRLKLKKDLIYPIAMDVYSSSKDSIQKVITTLELKVQLLGQITPILDILNYVASRVEDSIFDTKTLVKQIIIEHNLAEGNPDIIDDLVGFFTFVNEAASLFSTFQSNNRANAQHQYQLFFFFSQFFCVGGPEVMQYNEIFYFPQFLQKALSDEKIFSNYSKHFAQNLNNFFFRGLGLSYSADEALNIAFNEIFGDSVYQLNENFLESYLFSLNQKFIYLIKEFNQVYPTKSITFSKLIHIFFEILYYLIDKIFLRKNPKDAQENFHDQLTRYTPERITLRVLELQIFKDIPLSDNNWQDYYLSRNKKLIQKIFHHFATIPEDRFFTSKRLLKINMLYERGLLDSTPFLEKWIIMGIVAPFYRFQQRIENNLPENYNKEQLMKAILHEFSRGVIENTLLDRLEELAEYFAEIWYENLI